MSLARWLRLASTVAGLAVVLCGQEVTSDAALESFETNVRPLLAEHCYACHSAEAPSVFANLRLDSREGILRGGDSGPAVIPGDPGSSLLLRAVTGAGRVLMPPTGRLGSAQIDDLAAWIRSGAPWPEQGDPDLPDPSEAFDLEGRRRAHWAWQPLRPSSPPGVRDEDWPQFLVDRYVLARLEGAGLQPAPPADRHTLMRRLSFALTGLPPTPEEIQSFVTDDSPSALVTVVERLLDSPHFGERWARHWMDLVRYTESHGSEGDPDIPEAWRYRDYLIRAFNADVPYDQLVREHLAGDLLSHPRYNRDLGLNESALGTAHYRMVEHGFQPVDPREDRVKWVDNQIDVFSKAFLGLTVSCARCHDHKFDAISQRDYYALFGVFANARPIQRAVDTPELLHRNRAALRSLKSEVRTALAQVWLDSAEGFAGRLQTEDDAISRLLEAAACEPDNPLYPAARLTGLVAAEFEAGWTQIVADAHREQRRRKQYNDEKFNAIWWLDGDLEEWRRTGSGIEQGVTPAGEFSILPDGDQIVDTVYNAGVHSGLLSRRHNAVLQTPRFVIDTDRVSFLVQGSGLSVVRLIVENYAVPRAGIYFQRYSPKRDAPVWAGWDTTYWKGFGAYVEFATMKDSTNFLLDAQDAARRPRPVPAGDGRSHIGALAVAFHDTDIEPTDEAPAVLYLLGGDAPAGFGQLAKRYAARLKEAVVAWRAGRTTRTQAAFLDFFVRQGLLPTRLGTSGHLDALVAEYRKLEDEVPIYRRSPSVLEEAGPDQPLLIRGSHKRPGEPVPKGFLTALGGEPFADPARSRLRLAEAVTDAGNPLTARVVVNRVWHYLFGRGLVATVDNFGRLGNRPTHPALLDHLALEFMKDGWSIKNLIRRLVMTSTYQLGSEPSLRARQADPSNELLQHMPVRRLEGEVIRDSLLAVSGRLEPRLLGPPVPVYYAFAKGKTKGDRAKGPIDGDGRRSVYQEIRRNAHNPFLEVFDQPKPASTRGRRDVTNVPAQSLTMLNSPLVISLATMWGERLAAERQPPSETVRSMFLASLGRPPNPSELDSSLGYLGHNPTSANWADLAHAMFNLKEFLYVR